MRVAPHCPAPPGETTLRQRWRCRFPALPLLKTDEDVCLATGEEFGIPCALPGVAPRSGNVFAEMSIGTSPPSTRECSCGYQMFTASGIHIREMALLRPVHVPTAAPLRSHRRVSLRSSVTYERCFVTHTNGVVVTQPRSRPDRP